MKSLKEKKGKNVINNFLLRPLEKRTIPNISPSAPFRLKNSSIDNIKMIVATPAFSFGLVICELSCKLDKKFAGEVRIWQFYMVTLVQLKLVLFLQNISC